jgi:hypothetical protein
MKLRTCGAAVLALAALPFASAEAGIIDPAGDFLDSYTGPHGGDLDVLTADATFDGATFVWGVDRGTNATPFGAFRPGVMFDAVVVGNPNGNSTVNVSGVSTVLPSSAVTISGNMFTLNVPANLLPSAGFALRDYLVNLWPRNGLGNNAQIADFAPDNSDFQVRFLPEPSAALLLLGGLAGVFGRRKVKPST